MNLSKHKRVFDAELTDLTGQIQNIMNQFNVLLDLEILDEDNHLAIICIDSQGNPSSAKFTSRFEESTLNPAIESALKPILYQLYEN